MFSLIPITLVALIINSCFSSMVRAHVSLEPYEAVIGQQTYTINVPNEKNIPYTKFRLEIPASLEVTGILPIPGWTYELNLVPQSATVSADPHETTKGHVQEITWSGGKINPSEYGLFNLYTRYEGEPAELIWKAYQTYTDGSIVEWNGTNEQQPVAKSLILKESTLDRLKADLEHLKEGSPSPGASAALWFAFVAVLFSVAAFIISLKGKKIG